MHQVPERSWGMKTPISLLQACVSCCDSCWLNPAKNLRNQEYTTLPPLGWLWFLRENRGSEEKTCSRSGHWRTWVLQQAPSGGRCPDILVFLWILLTFRACFSSQSIDSMKHKSFLTWWSPIYVLSLVAHTLGVIFKKFNAKSEVMKICTYVFLYEFYDFTFLIYVFDPFWVNFYTWYEVGGPTSFCMWVSNWLSIICWKDCSFSFELFGHPYQKQIALKHEGLFLDSQFYPTVYSYANTTLLDYCCFVVHFKTWMF